MTKGKITILILGGLIIIALLYALIFIPTPSEIKTTETATTTATSTQAVDIGDGNLIEVPEGMTVTPIPSEEAIAQPDLTRPVSVPDFFPEDAAKNVATKIADAIVEVESDPTSFDAWLRLALLRQQIEDFEGTIEIYDYLNVVFPDNFITFLNLGNLYHLRIRDFEKAELNMRKSIEKNSTNPLAYISLHELYRDSYKRETTLAEDILLEGLSVIEEELNLLIALGEYYERQDRVEDAIEVLERAKKEAEAQGDSTTVGRIESSLIDLQSQ